LRTTAILTAIEDDRDKPSGAGVAPERQDEEPRAGPRRGKGGNGKTAFFAYLSRRLGADARQAPTKRLPQQATLADGSETSPAAFRNEAHQITARLTAAQSGHASDAGYGGASDDDSDLRIILAAIAEDVERWSAGARDGIEAKYAGQIAFARRHLSRHQVAGAIRAIIECRNAEVALIGRAAETERASRVDAALRKSRGKSPATNRKPSGNRPTAPDAPDHG
jgi:hypothetical protein